jgi:ABC-type amino acid transport substrate-binding protein
LRRKRELATRSSTLHCGQRSPFRNRDRKGISTALLAMKEDGTYQRIYEKWFGGE